ncbi:MAG: hypothetical protein MZU79_03205 [Anaerotruncus sp.]|nr:hypothetical protein [Anaerotruncus sp.]
MEEARPDQVVQQNGDAYGAEEIKILKGLEAVRGQSGDVHRQHGHPRPPPP